MLRGVSRRRAKRPDNHEDDSASLTEVTATTNIVCPHCDIVNRIPAARLGDRPVCGKCKQALFTGHPLVLNDGNFNQQLTRSDIPVVVDFWAPWCGPCKAIGPIIEQLAVSFDGKVKFCRFNVDDNPLTPVKFGIKAIPTLIFFKDGHVAEQVIGLVARAKLEEALNKLL